LPRLPKRWTLVEEGQIEEVRPTALESDIEDLSSESDK
jgi:hypothetical protein